MPERTDPPERTLPDALAERMQTRPGAASAALRELDAVDRAGYEAVGRQRIPSRPVAPRASGPPPG